MKKVLVTGPESSGTKLVAQLMTMAGADVLHFTPRGLRGDVFLDGVDFDAVVVVVRDGYATEQSMVQNSHAKDLQEAKYMLFDAMQQIYGALEHTEVECHQITYESVLLNNGAVQRLAEVLGLMPDFTYDKIRDANAKYFGGEYFEDRRSLPDRGVAQTPEYYYDPSLWG